MKGIFTIIPQLSTFHCGGSAVNGRFSIKKLIK